MFTPAWKVLRLGLWAPLLVLGAHLFLSRVVHAYTSWPAVDMPVHFAGGMAIAFMVARCFQHLPRESLRPGRVSLLELLLAVCVTVSAAVFWEFAEYADDRLFGTNVQVGLNNTMRDMAMGISGALVVAAARARQLRLRPGDALELLREWARAPL